MDVSTNLMGVNVIFRRTIRKSLLDQTPIRLASSISERIGWRGAASVRGCSLWNGVAFPKVGDVAFLKVGW
ncbi:hypothetical protein BC938DRAFT_473718 [Jimgerdemannia flammicorona]|uniref:Uncharacterized protein n=1 Tax=Jimgerdemannia flammicorona TaxID=994334 RepID=A0A433Q3G2_9FUNG|nr:hypothetical protein BC938DRAFT_473718 [Jimgerdemannia flammicorona]